MGRARSHSKATDAFADVLGGRRGLLGGAEEALQRSQRDWSSSNANFMQAWKQRSGQRHVAREAAAAASALKELDRSLQRVRSIGLVPDDFQLQVSADSSAEFLMMTATLFDSPVGAVHCWMDGIEADDFWMLSPSDLLILDSDSDGEMTTLYLPAPIDDDDLPTAPRERAVFLQDPATLEHTRVAAGEMLLTRVQRRIRLGGSDFIDS